MSKGITTTVDIVIRIEVVGEPADVENCRSALDCLADVMAVQAEDGLWSLGHEGAENADGPSEPIANITSTKVHAVLIDGVKSTCSNLDCEGGTIVESHCPSCDQEVRRTCPTCAAVEVEERSKNAG